VRRIVVGARGHGSRLPRCDMVGSFEQGRVELRPGALPVAADTALDGALEPDELLLVRDVLDTQIVDVDRHRVARVADVLLERDAAGALTVAGVEIGLSGVLRRLGLRRLASRLPRHAIDWQDLHLTSERGHAVQLATAGAAVHRLDDRDLAELLTRLRADHAADVMAAVGPDRAAQAVAHTHPTVGRSLLRALGPDQADRLVRAMPAEIAHRYEKTLHATPKRRSRRLSGWRLNRPPHHASGPR
jgi:hypothetical protein